ncbi:MAG: hypothetical protein WC330_07815, partial [Candidatus Omnitrophota bacterium]
MILPVVYGNIFQQYIDGSTLTYEDVEAVLDHIQKKHGEDERNKVIIAVVSVNQGKLDNNSIESTYDILLRTVNEFVQKDSLKLLPQGKGAMAMLHILHIKIEQLSPALQVEMAGIKGELAVRVAQVLDKKIKARDISKENFVFIATGLDSHTPKTEVENVMMRSVRIMFWNKASSNQGLMKQVAQDQDVSAEIRESAQLRTSTIKLPQIPVETPIVPGIEAPAPAVPINRGASLQMGRGERVRGRASSGIAQRTENREQKMRVRGRASSASLLTRRSFLRISALAMAINTVPAGLTAGEIEEP